MSIIQEIIDGVIFGINRGRMNANFEALNDDKVEATQVLVKGNTTVYTPTLDYDPATKLYADSLRTNWESVYDPQGINADSFDRANHTGTQLPATIATDSDNRFITDAERTAWNAKEDAIGTKQTGFNKAFGTTAGTVAEGNHSHNASEIGLGNVDNTSDVDKPISTLQQAALDVKLSDSELTDGSITSIKVGGVAAANEVVQQGQVDARSFAMRSLCGFDREDTTTMGILQYCHSASTGIVDNIDKDGNYTELAGQTHFADGTTILADRTFAIYHSATETQFSYWYQGTLVEVVGIKTVQLSAVSAQSYIAFEADGDLHIQTDAHEMIVSESLVGLVYHNSTATESLYPADERHGIVMDGQTHLNIHFQRGFGWVQGLEISGLADEATTFTGISSGRCGDEDIAMFYDAITSCPFIYRDGANGAWRKSAISDNTLGLMVGGKVQWNEFTGATWQLSEINADYVVMHFLATNNKKYPIVKLVGQTLYLTRSIARKHLEEAFYEIRMNGLPSPEILPLFSMIIHNESTGQIEVGSDVEVFYDCRHGFPVQRF